MVKEIKSELLNESYYEIDHKSGLKIFVMPKPGYSSCFAAFGTNYGSVDTCFRLKGEQEFTCVPEGIAHFLEHKLFESESGPVFEKFAKTGANANAYTSFDRTTYLFTCSDMFEENYEILLNFVQHPNITQEFVDKEQGIIAEEIRMYEDDPGEQVFLNSMRAMYVKSGVKNDIAGTVSGIKKITAKSLMNCYNCYYNPANLIIVISGDVTCEKAAELTERLIEKRDPVTVTDIFEEEPTNIAKKTVTRSLPVSQPICYIGFKDSDTSRGRELLKTFFCSEIALDIFTGKFSPLYTKLYDSGLVRQGFGGSYSVYGLNRHAIIGGETKNPARMKTVLKNELAKLKARGVTDEEFSIARRVIYGKLVRSFETPVDCASAFLSFMFNGGNIFKDGSVFAEITVQDIDRRISELFREENMAMSIVNPLKEH